MENSILTSTKKVLGIVDEYIVFDLDIITHINAAFSILEQIGIGPVNGFFIEDKSAVWSEFETSDKMTRMVRDYIYLKVRSLFDPPTTSFLIEAVNKQIAEFEYRLSYYREDLVPFPTTGQGDPL